MITGISLEEYLQGVENYIKNQCPELNLLVSTESISDLKSISTQMPFAVIGYSQIQPMQDCPHTDGLLGVNIQMYAFIGSKVKKGVIEDPLVGKLMKTVSASTFDIDACKRASRWVQTLTVNQNKAGAVLRRIIWNHEFFLDCS